MDSDKHCLFSAEIPIERARDLKHLGRSHKVMLAILMLVVASLGLPASGEAGETRGGSEKLVRPERAEKIEDSSAGGQRARPNKSERTQDELDGSEMNKLQEVMEKRGGFNEVISNELKKSSSTAESVKKNLKD